MLLVREQSQTWRRRDAQLLCQIFKVYREAHPEFFFWAGEGGCLVVRFGVKEIKSWNLNLWFWRLHWEFNSDCPHMQQVRVMNHVGQKCCHPPLFLDTSVVECGI